MCRQHPSLSYHTNITHPDSIEQQAFGRVFRIGQHKETHVSRLVIKNSIDMRLLSMQADKIRAIDRAMQDTDAGIVEPLSMTDLASLFGHLREYVELALPSPDNIGAILTEARQEK